mgnify:CR=1 FL=1
MSSGTKIFPAEIEVECLAALSFYTGIKEHGYRIQIWQFEFYDDIKTETQIHFKRQDATSIRHYHSKARDRQK